MTMPVLLPFVLLALSLSCLAAEGPDPNITAAEIMARVAANQDRSEQLRKNYVYCQHVHVATHKPHGKLMREETADYNVVPVPEGTRKELQLLTGRYLDKGHYRDFRGEPRPHTNNVDAELIDALRGDLAGDVRRSAPGQNVHIDFDEDLPTRDGIASGLFPLTSAQQEKYSYRLIGEEIFQGRPAYHIAFGPKNKYDFEWAGEAYIDKQEFQPMLVFTKLSRPVPFAVRAFLGTDLPGMGFSVQYARQPDGAWFPSSFGTEFHLKVLYFLNRDVSLSLDNRDFQHTQVDTRIQYEGELH